MNKVENILLLFALYLCQSGFTQHHLNIELAAGISKTDPNFDDNEFSKFQFIRLRRTNQST
jgi:hypothetical protein